MTSTATEGPLAPQPQGQRHQSVQPTAKKGIKKNSPGLIRLIGYAADENKPIEVGRVS
jgi:hypothetical protein